MEQSVAAGLVRGVLHEPSAANGQAIVLAHGAGSNCNAPLLITACRFFAEAGYHCLRIDLPFRQDRPSGPPSPATGAKDRSGLREACALVRGMGLERVILGGHSYGGRQATMLAAEDASVAGQLLLFSYPLHPPDKPLQLRTAHWPNIQTPCLFVHGNRDPFGSLEEMRRELPLIPACTRLMEVAGAHDMRRPPLPEICLALGRAG
ncbi:MAG: alpha/beta fold hydrolase [Candidatus Solibacter usitatus]|nr:alpha/beta fold hydrolase [Candidatus Solibacter usitatus]